MASSSALVLASNYRYKVFCSFHGPDVRKTLLSHIRKHFESKSITMFNDQGIERGKEIDPSLKDAIRESRISIVILSKKYASSGWCLNELVEILECRKTMGQIVMTIFYGVTPSEVRKQSGKFGKAFDETCASKTEEDKQKWSEALEHVANIAGADFSTCENEVIMIENIAKDVLDRLNETPSRDFDDMVGLEAHLREIQSLLDLDNDEVKKVAITGPAGIGKTTIAGALHAQLANKFQLSCFVDNLRESSHSGFHEDGFKLHLQERFLSKILNQSGMRISHLGAIKENLSDQRVLIILDDVNHLKQLEALANETKWFGPGSRIVVTTENKELLQQHDINDTYIVGFPSHNDALKILCKYAFRQTSPWDGFEKLARRVVWLCGKLPLGLRVVGSTLCGRNEDYWMYIVSGLEDAVDQEIEDVLRVGYESLREKEKTLFLHITVFFNNHNGDLVETMFEDSDYVKRLLEILEMRSLIEIEISPYGGYVVMHKLLQQVAKKAIQSQEFGKRQILIDPNEICDVLEDAKGTKAVSGISFDVSNINEVCVNKNAFKRLQNLRFLRVYKRRDDGNYRMHIPEEMEFPRLLRLIHWKAYPGKSLRAFNPDHLVELKMPNSQLEKLWEGNQRLTNLKTMDLNGNKNLKELPGLSNATKLNRLDLSYCESLVEIPSSFSDLHKLETLRVSGCKNLQVIPAGMNLASLREVYMDGCSRLRNIPVLSANISKMRITCTAVDCKNVMHPPRILVNRCKNLQVILDDMKASLKLVDRSGYSKLRKLPVKTNTLFYKYIAQAAAIVSKPLMHLPSSVTTLDISGSDMEEIPYCIKYLHQLSTLKLNGCRRLKSLPELPPSLISLNASDCESLETIFPPLNSPKGRFEFINCFKLGQIGNFSSYMSVILPGKTVPVEFDQRAKGKTLRVVLDGNKYYSGLLFCVLISPNHNSTSPSDRPELWCRPIGQYDLQPINIMTYDRVYPISGELLFIYRYSFEGLCVSEVNREVMFEFSVNDGYEITECGAEILTEEKSIEES